MNQTQIVRRYQPARKPPMRAAEKKLLTAIGATILALVVTVTGTLAYWNSEGKTIGQASTGTVGGVIVEDYPGDTVKKVVDVKNTGTLDMLVRVKVTKGWKNASLSGENIEIQYNSSKWTDGGDGYFYYKGTVSPGKTTAEPLFKEFTLSGKDTGSEYQGQRADITVNMECIQAAGNAVSAWNKTYAFLGVTEPKTTDPGTSTVTFQNRDRGFAFGPGSNTLLSGFADLSPGETRKQTIQVKNSADETLEFFLRAEAATQSLTGDQLAKMTEILRTYGRIKVTDSAGKVLYDGALWGNYDADSTGTSSMKNNISLGLFKKDEAKDLTVELSLDPNLGNDYQGLLGQVQWVFSARGEEAREVSDRPEGERDTDNEEEDGPLADDPYDQITDELPPLLGITQTPLPQTGLRDWTPLLGTCIAVFAALLILLIILYRRQSRSSNEACN